MPKRPLNHDERGARDDAVRQRQAEALLDGGITRASAVEGTGDALCPTETRAIPIQLIGDEHTAAFVAADRVIVPLTQLDAAERLVREHVEGDVVSKGIAGIDYGEIRTPFRPLPETLRDRLTSDEFMGRHNHLMFSAYYRYKVREGDDPETAMLPEPGHDPNVGRHARVAILDTGLARQATADPFLSDVAQMLADRDVDLLRMSGNPGDPLDSGAGHGTFVAGIVRQLAPGAQIEIVRVLDSNGTGLEAEIARGFERAIQLNPDVILCAFGGYSVNDHPPVALEAAVAGVPKNVLIVAAAGNEHQSRRPIWPASCRGVEAIAALESADDGTLHVNKGAANLAWYSNTGPHLRYAAAGTWTSSFVSGQESADRETDGHPDWFDNAAIAGGTSFAAAAIAGAVAAAMAQEETAVEAWDRVRLRTINVTASDLHAIDCWSLIEAM